MGKSAFVFSEGEDLAERREGFLGFSLEMPREEVAARMACKRAGVSLFRYLNTPNRLSPSEWARLDMAKRELGGLPFWLDDRPGITVPEMRSKARRVQAECRRRGIELRVIAVDYIQLAKAVRRVNGGREQEIAEVTSGLKELAKDVGVTVVALSQLNRKVEERPDKRPTIPDLRESGAIEQDADVVILMYRDDYYNKESRVPGVAELNVAKQRNGPMCTVYVHFEKKTVSFRDLMPDERQRAGLDDEEQGGEA
jgi:replicative DNA helicase